MYEFSILTNESKSCLLVVGCIAHYQDAIQIEGIPSIIYKNYLHQFSMNIGIIRDHSRGISELFSRRTGTDRI